MIDGVPNGGTAPLGEEWTDPEAPVDSAKVFADYIGRRANAVVVRARARVEGQ
jgi:hypothetical protein